MNIIPNYQNKNPKKNNFYKESDLKQLKQQKSEIKSEYFLV